MSKPKFKQATVTVQFRYLLGDHGSKAETMQIAKEAYKEIAEDIWSAGLIPDHCWLSAEYEEEE